MAAIVEGILLHIETSPSFYHPVIFPQGANKGKTEAYFG
jgi:hypothetical protein